MFSHTKKEICEVIGVLINKMGGILSQCIHVSNHHNTHLNILQFYCQLYLSKAEKILVIIDLGVDTELEE